MSGRGVSITDQDGGNESRKHSDQDSESTVRDVLAGGRRLRGPRLVSLDRAVVGTGLSYDAVRRVKQGAVLAALVPRMAIKR